MIEQLLWKFLQIVTMLNPLQINSGPSGQMNETRADDRDDNHKTLTWKRVSKYVYNTTAREGVIQTIPAG
jgi:hypothetical protein